MAQRSKGNAMTRVATEKLGTAKERNCFAGICFAMAWQSRAMNGSAMEQHSIARHSKGYALNSTVHQRLCVERR